MSRGLSLSRQGGSSWPSGLAGAVSRGPPVTAQGGGPACLRSISDEPVLMSKGSADIPVICFNYTK